MPRPRPQEPELQQYRERYYIVWWEGGTRRRVSTGTSDRVRARQSLADFQAKLEHRPLKLTAAEALDRYIAARSAKVVALGRLKDAAGALKAAVGDLRVDQVNQSQWDRYAAQRVTRPPARGDKSKHKPRPVSTGTLRREFNVLRAALRLAWKDGYLVKPPAIDAPPDSAPRDRFLTKDEARKLIAACVTPHVRVFLAIALFTGARKGSILALSWDRVNFQTGMIDFQEPDRRLTSRRRSVVPINASLLPVLETANRVKQSNHVVEYFGKPVPTGLRWSFRRLCERAGLNWVPTPHHIKHSVASWFAMERVPIDQAADWLATDPRTLRRVYRKFDPAYLRSVGTALDL
jgi:integrase